MPRLFRESVLAHRLQAPRDWLTVRWRRAPASRFVLFCQGRSGSSLLESLLASHQDVHRSTEILSKRRRLGDLHRFLDAASRRSAEPVWGAKIKVQQLDYQGVDARELLPRMHGSGWRIIHLWRRDTLRQAVSHFVRLHRGAAHRKDDEEEELHLRLDPAKLLQAIESRLTILERERAALGNLPYAEVVYEDDLLDGDRHQPTADRLFAFLGVSSAPVSTNYRKVTPQSLPDLIENWAEIRGAVAASRHAHFLDQTSPGSPVLDHASSVS